MTSDRQRHTDPMQAARLGAGRSLPKRFYTHAEMVEEDGRLALRLDGKPARTPARRILAVPTRALADAVTAEWLAQEDTIDPAAMPATRLANTALDGVAGRMDEVRDSIRAYAASDLLYYRTAQPEGLVRRQHEIWDPVLGWAARDLGARFILAEGVVHVAQPDSTLAALARRIGGFDEPFRLTGLHMATTLTGSALIGLALAAGALDVDAAWAAGHVDEDWNISQWGADAEAAHRREQRFADFRAAALALGVSG